MEINWKVRIKNKNFWLSFIPAILLLVQAVASVFGYKLEFGELGDKLLLPERADISVFDMSGSLVVRKAVLAGEVDMSSLVRTNGVYRVVVRQGREKLVATWAKVR